MCSTKIENMKDKLDYIAIDFETANYYKNSSCSVGFVRFINGKETDSCYSLIHPAKMYFIPEWTETIHHISYDDVRDKPYFPEVWDSLVMPFINQTPDVLLVAHNGTTFDMNVIRDCCNYFGMEVPKLDHNLMALGEHFNIIYQAHDALEDSRTCGKIIELAAKEFSVSLVSALLAKCNLELTL